MIGTTFEDFKGPTQWLTKLIRQPKQQISCGRVPSEHGSDGQSKLKCFSNQVQTTGLVNYCAC